MTQYGDNKCLDCKNNRKCYMRSRNCHECGVEFVCKLEEDKKIEKIKEYQMTYPEGGLREDEAGEQIETIVKKINEIIEVINGRD